MAKSLRKRRWDKDDEELAREIAEIAGVTNYMQKVSEEEIKRKGDLSLKQVGQIAAFGFRVLQDDTKTEEDVEETEKGKLDAAKKEDKELKDKEITPTLRVIPESDKPSEGGLTPTLRVIPDSEDKEITPTLGVNRLTPTLGVIREEKDKEITPTLGVNRENQKIITPALELNRFSLTPTLGVNLQSVKVHFEQEHLIRFINGAHTILFYPNMDHRIKIVLLIILLKAVCERSVSTKIKTSDLLRILAMSKSIQKDISRVAEETGIAKVTVRRKGGTEVTFNEEIFNPYGKNSSNGLVSMFVINNILTTITYDEGKVEEKKLIPLTEIGKYTSLISLHLAGFPLSAATSNLIETIKGKDTELVTAFWIQANLNSTKIKSPSAYLIKVLNDGDPGHISGEIMEKAKICVKAAQTIIHENYDEPELGFLKNLAQRLSLVDAYYKDRASLTTELKTAGRKLIDECEKVLNKLPKKGEPNVEERYR